MKRDSTTEVAKYWAKTGTDVLFAEGDPFCGTVDRQNLEDNIYNQILKNLVDLNTTDISEHQLQQCIEASKIHVTNNIYAQV